MTNQIKFTLGLNDAGFAPAAAKAEKAEKPAESAEAETAEEK